MTVPCAVAQIAGCNMPQVGLESAAYAAHCNLLQPPPAGLFAKILEASSKALISKLIHGCRQ